MPGGRSVADLLADREMQAHVQERVGLAALGRVVAVERTVAGLEYACVLRVQFDDADDLVLDRLHRQGGAVLAPGLDVHAAQRGAALVVEERHQCTLPRVRAAGLRAGRNGNVAAAGKVFSGQSQRSTTGQCVQSGFSALQT